MERGKPLVYSGRESTVAGVGHHPNSALRDFGKCPIPRAVIDDYNIGASGQRGIEARADFRLRIVGNDNDADFGHVSLCPTPCEQKVHPPIEIEAVGGLCNA